MTAGAGYRLHQFASKNRVIYGCACLALGSFVFPVAGVISAMLFGHLRRILFTPFFRFLVHLCRTLGVTLFHVLSSARFDLWTGEIFKLFSFSNFRVSVWHREDYITEA